MKRFATEDLKKWKEKPNRKPLVIMGARQVGKTWLMKEFGAKFYKKTAYISFYNNSELKKVFDTDYDINRILSFLNIAAGFPITPGDTLIIFGKIFASAIPRPGLDDKHPAVCSVQSLGLIYATIPID